MLGLMSEKEKAAPKRPKNNKVDAKWFLYILLCRDGTFYTGVTKDLSRRLIMHNKGKASRYTRTRRPVELLYQETCLNRTQALIRECEVKALPRKKTERLTNTFNV